MTIFGELWVNSVAGAMTLFEYISVAVSIIIALTIAEGLRGLRSALDSSRRYSIHNAGHKKNPQRARSKTSKLHTVMPSYVAHFHQSCFISASDLDCRSTNSTNLSENVELPAVAHHSCTPGSCK